MAVDYGLIYSVEVSDNTDKENICRRAEICNNSPLSLPSFEISTMPKYCGKPVTLPQTSFILQLSDAVINILELALVDCRFGFPPFRLVSFTTLQLVLRNLVLLIYVNSFKFPLSVEVLSLNMSEEMARSLNMRGIILQSR